MFFLCKFRYDADDCEIDSEGDDDDVNGNEDGEGGGNEDDSEEGWLRTQSCNNCKWKVNYVEIFINDFKNNYISLHINSSEYTYRNIVSDEEDEDFLDDDPGLDIVYKEKFGVSLVDFTF